MTLSEITWRAVQQAPDDGRRREAIGGELYVSPAPNLRHRRVARRLQRELRRLLGGRGVGQVLRAPVAVAFPLTGEGVQPDLLFVSEERREIVADDGLEGPPDLVVEIVSPGTEERDRSLKLDLYLRQGVPAYWIVDPDAEAVDVWSFGRPVVTLQRFTERLPVRLGGVVAEIDLDEVFRPGP